MTQVQLSLDTDDAIIVFEILNRLGEKPGHPLIVSEPEQASVDALICALESVLAAPFGADYAARVDRILSNRQGPSEPEETQ